MPNEQKEGIYDTLTSDSDKSSNSWVFFAKVSEAFIKAFVVAVAIALAVILLPDVVVAGIAITLAVGCVVMTAVPEEKVPSWLQGARDIGDKLLNDPLSIIGDMGQGFMDQIQTPEGIATVAGEFTGGLAGGIAGAKLKPKLSAKVKDVPSGSSVVDDVAPKKTGGTRNGADAPLGSKHNQMNQPSNPKYQPVRNRPTQINGRNYSGHALDRMQDRGIMPSVVEDVVTHGKSTPSYGGTTKYYSTVNKVSVVVNAKGKVVTVTYGGK